MEPNWAGSIQGLALLATGKPEYLPKLRDFAHGLAKENPDPDKKPSESTWGDAWNMGYRLLFLCECSMVTSDREVLPAIEKGALVVIGDFHRPKRAALNMLNASCRRSCRGISPFMFHSTRQQKTLNASLQSYQTTFSDRLLEIS